MTTISQLITSNNNLKEQIRLDKEQIVTDWEETSCNIQSIREELIFPQTKVVSNTKQTKASFCNCRKESIAVSAPHSRLSNYKDVPRYNMYDLGIMALFT